MARSNGFLHWLLDPPPACLGIEFRRREAVLVRFDERRRGLEMDLCLKAPLPDGVIELSMLEPNIKELEGLARFLRFHMEQAGVRNRRVALTLPDTLARVAIVDLPEAPRRQKDVGELLRFRMKKSLPFAMDKARVAFEPVTREGPRFFTGVMHEDVVSQYENLFEAMGFHVGCIEVASLSLLKLWHPVVARELPPGADYFFINVEEQYFSVLLVRRNDPLLVRTLGHRGPAGADGGPGPYGIDELVQEIVPTLIFYREKLDGDTPARVYYRSLRPDLADLEAVLEAQFATEVEPFDLLKAVSVAEHLHIDGPLAAVVGPAAAAALGQRA